MGVKTNHAKEDVIYSKVKGCQETDAGEKVETFGIQCFLKIRKHFGTDRKKSLLLLEDITTSESIIDRLINILVNHHVPPIHARDVVEDQMNSR